MELALDIIGERFTTLYQMSKPTYLSRDVFAPLEIGILTSINHGGHLARLPVSYGIVVGPTCTFRIHPERSECFKGTR